MGKEVLSDKNTSPPLSWYYAVGHKDRGIKSIGVSDTFLDLGSEMRSHWDEYTHYKGNIKHEEDTPERKERAAKATAAAETYIFQKTGFTPGQILDTLIQLRRDYRGKMNAPIETELC